MSGRAHVILTVDYEVFGNGSGCVINCVVDPMERLAAVVERHGARAVVFVEALEFAAMEEAGLKDIAVVKKQLVKLVESGHEIQLHLHPQWDTASREGNGGWHVDTKKWRIGDVDEGTIRKLIMRGTDWIRTAVSPAVNNYQCTVFRAGSWAIQPSSNVVTALRNAGFRADSTVAPGAVCTRPTAWFDFRNASGMPWWHIDGDVATVGQGPMIEVPIAVGRLGLARHLAALGNRKAHGEFATGCLGTYEGRARRLDKCRAIWNQGRGGGRAMLDFCALPASLMRKVTMNWIGQFPHSTRPIPVVAIGHTKNFSDVAENELNLYLAWLKCQEQVTISAYGQWLDTVDQCAAVPS